MTDEDKRKEKVKRKVRKELGLDPEPVKLPKKEKEWWEENKERIQKETSEYIRIQNGGSQTIHEVAEALKERCR